MAKRSATQKAIDRINYNIRQVAETFGLNSEQYEQVTQDIFFYEVYTNEKTGAIQIRNNAKNRKKHQTIRSRAKRMTNVKEVKKAELKRLDKYNKRAKTKINSLKAFEQLQMIRAEKEHYIYDVLLPLAQEYNIDIETYKMFQSSDYLNDKIAEINAFLEYDIASDIPDYIISGIATEMDENGNIVTINRDTGAVIFEYTGGDI